MLIKTSQLEGPALDWAVAKAAGRVIQLTDHQTWFVMGESKSSTAKPLTEFSPSSDGHLGMSIIKREGISLQHRLSKEWQASKDMRDTYENEWSAHRFDANPPKAKAQYLFVQCGHDPLVAAMRCYVAAYLGFDVDIPDELVTYQPGVTMPSM